MLTKAMIPNPDVRSAQLPSGKLTYVEYGVPDGYPVLFHHGWPSSRLQACFLHEGAVQQGLRIISPDRPGIGGSAYVPNRKLKDWLPVAVALMDSLGFGRFAACGVSGGGPYTMSLAAALPDRISAIALICAAPEVANEALHAHIHPGFQKMLKVVYTQQRSLQWGIWLMRNVMMVLPPAGLRAMMRNIPAPDKAALSNPESFAWHYQGLRVAWGGHYNGMFTDGLIYADRWPFRPGEIRAPATLWHGRDDGHFHFTLAQALADSIPNCRCELPENEGHFSLPMRNGGIIMERLKADIEANPIASSK